MKQRVLVMNGQRLVQDEHEGKWVTGKVERAGNLKAGIYNIYLSTQADKAKTHDGVIMHADRDNFYQKVGKDFVKHNRADFDVVPLIGDTLSIKYDGGKAVAVPLSIKLGRGIS